MAEIGAGAKKIHSHGLAGYGYVSGYRAPKSITAQILILEKLMPRLGRIRVNEKLVHQPVPVGAEGWFVSLRWQLVASTYGGAVLKMLNLIEKVYGNLYNWRAGKITPQHIRQLKSTYNMFRIIEERQKDYNALLLPCQFGLRHQKLAVGQVIDTIKDKEEFGSDPFTTAIMLLTHDNRLRNSKDLKIHCPGGEYKVKGKWNNAPFFGFDNEMEFGTTRIGKNNGDADFGSATCFLMRSTR